MLKFLPLLLQLMRKCCFFDKTINGVSSLIGIEFMAQAVGCYSYFKSCCKPPEIGFLLGSRLFNNALGVFENGKTFTIKVHESFTDNQISAFDCIIYNESAEEIASATVKVYQSEEAKELLK